MNKIDEIIEIVKKGDKEEKEEVNKFANEFREIANLLDELVEEGKTREDLEVILGKIIVRMITLGVKF